MKDMYWEYVSVALLVLLVVVVLWWRVSMTSVVDRSEAVTRYGTFQLAIDKSSVPLQICSGPCVFREEKLAGALKRCLSDDKCGAFSYDETSGEMMYIDKDVPGVPSDGSLILTLI